MNLYTATRQRPRAALLLIMFLFFPIIMNYFSPYVIIDGASQGIVNGSLIVFATMFVASLFVGRLWCGWVCPAGAIGELAFAINDNPVNLRRIDWIKWIIWGIWLSLIIFMVIQAGGYHAVNFTLDTVGGISVAGDADRPILAAYFFYYLVIGIFLTQSILIGRRAACHTTCWMSPFMITGRKLRNMLAWPSLRLQASPDQCADCKKCTRNCPMSLDVNAMVQANKMEHSECILCGTCVDNCTSKAIHFTFSSGK
jgi:ferredoxin-type protein NapH